MHGSTDTGWLNLSTVTRPPHTLPHPPLASAMLLAAGRGDRMRPLTDVTPKPLLTVHGHALLSYPLKALAASGVRRVLINTAWLGEQIPAAFGPRFEAGERSSVDLVYSHEGVDFGGALETAGGIVRALPQLDEVFWVAAGDVYAPDFAFPAHTFASFKASDLLAHIWLVPNPAHHPSGDFGLSDTGLALNLPKSPVATGVTSAGPVTQARYTFSTMALYKRAFFEAEWCPIPPGNPAGLKAPLAPMLRAAMDQGRVGASLYEGVWVDVGTPERLAQLNAI